MSFGNRRHFRELLATSEDGIASNILGGRLPSGCPFRIVIGPRLDAKDPRSLRPRAAADY